MTFASWSIREFQLKAKTGKLPQISTPDTDNYLVPVPPLPVQSEIIRNEIDEYIKGMKHDEYLFPSITGDKTKPISRVMAYNILNEAAHQVGIEEIGTHTLRKTFGYHFYQQYKDVALLQELFNHSAPSVTLRYIGINQDIMDKAVDNFSL